MEGGGIPPEGVGLTAHEDAQQRLVDTIIAAFNKATEIQDRSAYLATCTSVALGLFDMVRNGDAVHASSTAGRKYITDIILPPILAFARREPERKYLILKVYDKLSEHIHTRILEDYTRDQWSFSSKS